MKLNIKDLKNLMSKISVAVEKSKINPKSGWIELETVDNLLVFKVSNYDYYLNASIEILDTLENYMHVTLLAETFIPLISKLDCDNIELEERLNCLIVTTDTNTYTFPLIKELGKTKTLDEIKFNNFSNPVEFNGRDLASVATINSKGLVSALFSKDIQQYIYLDNAGAITFTENIYVNNFSGSDCCTFKALLTATQSKLLEIFDGYEKVNVFIEHSPTFNKRQTETNKLCFISGSVKLIIVAQPMDLTEEFPCIKLRQIASQNSSHSVTVDKKLLDKALNRLMVFDKVFDSTVLDYSKIIFKDTYLELVSIKNRNSEKINYINSANPIDHESMIRFADLVKQLKAINKKEITISYGERPAIVLESDVKLLIPEIKMINRV